MCDLLAIAELVALGDLDPAREDDHKARSDLADDPKRFTGVFSADGYRVGHTESYRPKWPTLGMYHHTLFVLDRR